MKNNNICSVHAQVEIIVPVFNAQEDVRNCFDSILSAQSRVDFRVIVVDDGSESETKKWMAEFCARHSDRFVLATHESNRGYTVAVNTGLQKSVAPYVILLNSDTIVTDGWLEALLRCADSDPKIGIVGPLSNAASWQSVPTIFDKNGDFSVNPLPAGMRPNDLAAIVSTLSQSQYPRVHFVNGFCFLIKRQVINSIGLMDDTTFPQGYGEENDYCIRAQDHGFILAIADNGYVYHAKSKSFGHERRKALSANASRLLANKHSQEKISEFLAKTRSNPHLLATRERIVRHLEDVQSKATNDFDQQWYLSQYPDVQMLGMDPREHYLWIGRKLGRRPVPPSAAGQVQSHANALMSVTPEVASADIRPVIKQSPRLSPTNALGLDSSERLANLIFGATGKSDDFDKVIAAYIRPSSGKKIVIYTAIFGKYDYIRDPAYIDPEIDYICFTDQENLKSDVFTIVKVEKLFANSTRCARMLKTLPHIFLPGYSISIWIDSSTRIRGSNIRNLLETCLKDHDIAVHNHFQRNCVYAEAEACIRMKKDDKSTIDRQIGYLRSTGFPLDNGLVETAQLIRKHSDRMRSFNEEWWSYIRDFSVRDQLSFNAVCWTLGVEFYPLPGCQWLDPYFKNYLHTKGQKVSCDDNDSVVLIMLVRNALEMTRKSVASILRLTGYESYRLVIVDNDSDTDTKDYLSSVAGSNVNVDIITNAENLSFSAANNNAARDFPADYYVFINNDIEIIDRDWLSALLGEIKSNEQVGVVGPILLYPNYKIQSASINIEFTEDSVKIPATENRTYRHTGFVDGVTGGCMLVRRSVHEAIGGFDERFFYGQEDIDYCLKVRELGYKIKLLASCEAIHHESHTRRFSPRTLTNREILRLKWKDRATRLRTEAPVVKGQDYPELLRTKPIQFKAFDDLASDIKRNLALLPSGMDLIVGISGPGMLAAYVIGAISNRPVISLEEFLGDVRPMKTNDVWAEAISSKAQIEVLFVDDGAEDGSAFRRVPDSGKREYLGRKIAARFLAVYRLGNWTSDEVMTLSNCDTPALFQWNYLNHGIAQHACYELDGVLCANATEEQNDDGKLYLDYIQNARPLYVPDFRIRAIVTSRLEKYREATEEWLSKHGVSYDRLYMLDCPSKDERSRLGVHKKFKADLYAKMTDTFLFVESNSEQASEIASAAKKPVICTENDKFYQ